MKTFKPYNYQRFAIEHLLKNTSAGLFMEMGLGKTVCTLTAINEIICRRKLYSCCLVIAPVQVARDVWGDEIEKWAHLRHLKIIKVMGDERERLAALKQKGDIYIISRHLVDWLVALFQSRWPFKWVIIDELSSFKSAKSSRFKALSKVLPFIERATGLTGTPAPNGIQDLWSQLMLLDKGVRLGISFESFKTKYCYENAYTRRITVGDKARQEIFDKIGDICISMRARDYIDLPPRLDREVKIHFSASEMSAYRQFERDMLLPINDTEITAFNAAVLTGKLLQFCNGFLYDENKVAQSIHRKKLEALDDIIDTATSPLLIFYSFQEDKKQLLEHLKKHKPRTLKTTEDKNDWNEGKIKVMLAHPASAGHGLNIQAGGNTIVWFGIPWSLELYEQANARLERQGQMNTVIIHHLLIAGTMDYEVMQTLTNKSANQNTLKKVLKARSIKLKKELHEPLHKTA